MSRDVRFRQPEIVRNNSHCEIVGQKASGDRMDENEWMRINGFGVREPKGKLCNILELCLCPVNGGESIKVNACKVPFISKGLENHHVENMKSEFPHLEKL